MTVKLGVVMDPIADITYKKDTTLALLDAAQQRGCELWYMEQSDLSIQNGRAMARMAPLNVRMNPEDWFDLGEYQELPLGELDILLMVTVSVVVVVEIRGILSAIDAVMKARTSQGAIALIVRLLIAVTTIVRQAPTR